MMEILQFVPLVTLIVIFGGSVLLVRWLIARSDRAKAKREGQTPTVDR